MLKQTSNSVILLKVVRRQLKVVSVGLMTDLVLHLDDCVHAMDPNALEFYICLLGLSFIVNGVVLIPLSQLTSSS